MFVIALASLLAVASAGVIQHGAGGGHGQATSYQHVKIENFHAVPVYIKKEHQQFLEHPVSKGHTSTSVEVHHGGHHDHGYALVDGTHQAAGGHEALVSVAGHEGLSGHYEQGAELAGHGVQAYEGQQGAAGGYGHESAGGYGHESAGYEQAAAGYGQQGQDAGYGQQGQDAGYGHESAGYGQEAAAYEQEDAGYGHEGAAAAYEQAAGANQGHQGHYHH